MKTNLLGTQLNRLLSGVSTHGKSHLLEVETDLSQTALLLANAVEKLGASFIALHEAASAQIEEVGQLLAGCDENDPRVEQLRVAQKKIAHYSNEAVIGLQFQDLTSQLLAKTVQRTMGLRNALSVLEHDGNFALGKMSEDEIIGALTEMTNNLVAQSDDLKDVLKGAVHQMNLNSGDIDVF